MDSVMKLCSDLQQNETPFQLSVKILGSVDFQLSTMPSQQDENVNYRSGDTSWHHRGPSYLRRLLKRSLEKKTKKSQGSCEDDDEMTRWSGGGGSRTTPTKKTKKTYVPAESAAKSFVPEQLKVTNNEPEVGAPNLDGGEAKELEGGGGGGESVAKEKGKSDTQGRPDLVDQTKEICEELKIQKKILRGCMSIISENIFPIYNVDHGAHHVYANVEHTDSYIEKCRKDFGLPSVSTEREWQKKSCDDEGMDIPPKISQKFQSCWSPDDICLICNQRKPRFCPFATAKQMKHDCNLRYDEELNNFVPK